jgi:Zinc dependent phospholipase C
MKSRTQTSVGWWLALLIAMMSFVMRSGAYSVLTHEELIDLAWNDSIRPLLLAKFPGATNEQLIEAHAYAYGGSAIQDMGYYPFGKRLFSNLTHYVRTGDFIAWQFQNARTINEYAFAIGALSHYLGDTIGHSQAINPATATEFPKLKRKFGDSVTYGESPHSHIRTEFAFDVEEMKNTEFAPPAYLRRVGFKVPGRFLERAFVATYGFDLHEITGRSRPALRSYRTSVRSFIPSFAEAEVVLHGHQFPPHPDDEPYRIFADRVARTNYERRWKHTYKGPGFRAHLLAILVFLVPKIGAASDLAIKIPNHETDDAYLRSVNHTVDVFREILNKARNGDDPMAIANLDLDTGDPARLGTYELADQSYAQLLKRITELPDRKIPDDLKRHLLQYYDDPAPGAKLPKAVPEELSILREMKTHEEH